MISCLGSLYAGSSYYELESCFLSLSRSTLLPSQFVLVQDGPIPDSFSELIDKYRSLLNIQDVILTANQGLGPALCHGLEYCKFDIVVRIDTDDIYLPNHIQNSFDAFSSDPYLDVHGTSIVEFIHINPSTVSLSFKLVPTSNDSIYTSLCFRNPLNHPSVSFRKKSILSVGSYEALRFFEDYFLWLKCKKHNLRFLNHVFPSVLMRRDALLLRRSGSKYFLHEINFTFICLCRFLISPVSLIIFIARAISRLLPNYLQSFQNRLPWRSSRNLVTSSPDQLLRNNVDLSYYQNFF